MTEPFLKLAVEIFPCVTLGDIRPMPLAKHSIATIRRSPATALKFFKLMKKAGAGLVARAGSMKGLSPSDV